MSKSNDESYKTDFGVIANVIEPLKGMGDLTPSLVTEIEKGVRKSPEIQGMIRDALSAAMRGEFLHSSSGRSHYVTFDTAGLKTKMTGIFGDAAESLLRRVEQNLQVRGERIDDHVIGVINDTLDAHYK